MVKIAINSVDVIKNLSLINGFSPCLCGECDRVFFQKSTLLEIFTPFVQKYNHLPLFIEFLSFKVPNDTLDSSVMKIFMYINHFHSLLKTDIEIEDPLFEVDDCDNYGNEYYLSIQSLQKIVDYYTKPISHLPLKISIEEAKCELMNNLRGVDVGTFQPNGNLVVIMEQIGNISVDQVKSITLVK